MIARPDSLPKSTPIAYLLMVRSPHRPFVLDARPRVALRWWRTPVGPARYSCTYNLTEWGPDGQVRHRERRRPRGRRLAGDRELRDQRPPDAPDRAGDAQARARRDRAPWVHPVG